MPITAGSISVARRINTGDYSHKEAKAEVHYTVEGGEEVEAVAMAAQHLAISRLAASIATEVTFERPPEIRVATVTVGEPAVAEEPKQEEPAKRHRRTKAEIEAARAAEVAMVEQQVAEDPTAAGASTPSGASDASAAPASDEISDKELNNACNETMNRIKNKVAIQGVIQQYTDGGVSTIPQEQRAQFLSLLKAL